MTGLSDFIWERGVSALERLFALSKRYPGHAYLAFAVVWIVVCSTCGACHGKPPVSLAPATVEARARAATVYVGSVCGVKVRGGSGVVLDEHRILTAKHVLPCDDPTLVVDSMPAVVAAVNLEADLAVLRVAATLAPTPPLIAPPETGSGRVCIAAAVPARTWRCGRIDEHYHTPGRLWHTVQSTPGNSGGGIFDAKTGALLGIHTNGYIHSPGGYGTALLRSEVPQ